MTEFKPGTYLNYLPAVYRAHPFLGQFLQPFEQVMAGFDSLLAEIDRYFAPLGSEALPLQTDADWLPWLATWVALVLDDEWDEAQRRQFIHEAVELYRWRGTVKGLKRYLEIYTGFVPEIYECRWPGGMQIGAASQIGGTTPEAATLTPIRHSHRREPLAVYDYYVIRAPAYDQSPPDVPAGQIVQCYYRADRVEAITINGGTIDIWTVTAAGELSTRHYESATITRRDALPDDGYDLFIGDASDPIVYHGDTWLVDDVELPYRFIVEVKRSLTSLKLLTTNEFRAWLNKVRAIIDQEKPAHTHYYLRITPVSARANRPSMQIQVRSTMGVDTLIG